MPAYQRPPAGPPRIVLGGDTDPLLKAAERSPEEITDPGKDAPQPSRPTLLGVLLAAALAASLVVSLVLWVKLQRARDELADAEATQETAANQVAALPVPPETVAAVLESKPDLLKPDASKIPAPKIPKVAAAPQPERLLLLVTVGSQHFAEKQLRELKRKCRAPLAVYQQRGGRCAWSTCFAVAAAEADADLARNCGETKGQALREKTDFIPVKSSR